MDHDDHPDPLTNRPTLQPHRGVLILVLGLVALGLGCLPLGIPAWIMANHDLAEIDAGRMDPEGRNLALGGKIIGIISVVLLGLFVVGIMVAILGALLAA